MDLLDTKQLSLRIGLLPDREFADLCNTLLSLTTATCGVPQSHLDLTLNIDEPEGGLDARAIDVPQACGRFLAQGTTGYQYKSRTRTKSAARIAADDIVGKPRVMELLREGGTFVYLAGWDRASGFEGAVRKALRQQGVEIGPRQFVFIGSGTLAQLLNPFPSLVAKIVGTDDWLLSFDQWAQHGPLTNPYQVDDAVAGQLESLRDLIERGNRHVRLVGAPGDGKTRLVLEALRSSELLPTVLYSPQREYVTPRFAAYLRTTPGVRCTLVVDEVDEAGADDLALLFSGVPGEVRVITIGQDASDALKSGSVRVRGLSEELLIEAISAIATGISPDVAREIARVCQHSPKLAVLIAHRVAERPDLAAPHLLLADGDVLKTLDRFLGIDEADPTWNAISSFALLQRVGWSGDVEGESEALFRAVSIEPRMGRRMVERVHSRAGIVPQAGRFRYVSPGILGDYLAAKQLTTWTREDVRTFLEGLTPVMARSFALRVRRMSRVLTNRRVIEEVVLGEQGPFRHLSDLEHGALAELVPIFSGLFPRATLGCLRRLIEGASDADLMAATTSRRALVNALDELLWRTDTFTAAARLLLRLAANENETWANNASGIWKETFQVHLGRTAAGPAPRLQVLRAASESQNADERRLAAEALGEAVHIEDTSRMGMPPKDVAGMPEEAWQPATYGEWFDALNSYFTMLGVLVGDQDDRVQSAAAKALRQGVNAAIKFPVTDSWIAAAHEAISANFEIRSELAGGISDQSAWTRDQLEDPDLAEEEEGVQDPEVRAAIHDRLQRLIVVQEELLGKAFSTRFRWAVTREPHFSPDEYHEAIRKKEADLQDLAREAIASPELMEAEWTWLSELPSDTGQWIHALGVVDTGRHFAERLLELTSTLPRAIMWLSLYEIGYAAGSGEQEWIDQRLRALRHKNASGEILLDLISRSGFSQPRLELLVELIRSGEVSGREVARFIYGDWTVRADAESINRLIDAAVSSGDPDAVLSSVRFLATMFNRANRPPSTSEELILRVLRTPVETPAQSGFLSAWADLAELFVDRDPVGLFAAALHHLSRTDLRGERDLRKVLARAWEVGDKQALFQDLIGPVVVQSDGPGWRLRRRLKRFDLSSLGTEFLSAWIAQDPEIRALAIAEIIGAPLAMPSGFHAMLLEHFGEHGVGNVFFGNFLSGTHWGSSAAWAKGKLAEARRWVEDPRPAVRSWAEDVVTGLEEMVRREEDRDAEEDLRLL